MFCQRPLGIASRSNSSRRPRRPHARYCHLGSPVQLHPPDPSSSLKSRLEVRSAQGGPKQTAEVGHFRMPEPVISSVPDPSANVSSIDCLAARPGLRAHPTLCHLVVPSQPRGSIKSHAVPYPPLSPRNYVVVYSRSQGIIAIECLMRTTQKLSSLCVNSSG